MRKFSIAVLAASAGLAIAMPAAAQDQPAADQVSADKDTTPIDPARLAAAKQTIDYLVPEGTYSRMMMDGTFKGLMNQIADNTAELPIRSLAKSYGVPATDLKKLDKVTIADVMEVMDPAYKQRMSAMMDAMMPAMIDMVDEMEPGFREGLVRAYAKHFTLAQLNDINRFFATPSGNEYASNALMLQMDPEVMARQAKEMPKIMQELVSRMPQIVKDMQAATADLPKAKEYKDLTPEEKAKLAKLLGVDQQDMAAKSGNSARESAPVQSSNQ